MQAASWITFKAERLIARYGMPKEQALQEAGDAYETGIDKHGAQVRMDFNDPKVYTVTDPTEADILQNHIDSRAGSNLQGLPGPIKVGGFDSRVHFKSSAAVQQIAEQFYQLPRVRHYLTVNPERGARIADWFHGAKDGSSDPAVRAAYAKFAAETLAQYHELVKAGYTFEFYPRDENGQLTDPYPNGPRHAMIDLTKNKHLFVFPDEGGTGGAADMTSAHPLAGDSGVQWNGQRVSHNELFRGVHDVFGHHKEGVGFRADGEENAFQSHRVMYSPEAQRAMASETRGQNSWVNFGPHGKANQTANQADTVYADQKAVLAPDWVINDGTPRPLHEVNPIAAWEGTIMRHAVSLGAKVTRGGISKGAAADAEQSILDFAKRNPDHPTSQAIMDLYSRAVEARNSGSVEQYFQHESVPSPYHIQSAFGTAAFEAVARDASLKPVVDEATSLREEGSNAGARAAIRNATSDDARARAHLMDAYIALAHEDQARHLGSVLPQDLLKQRDMRLTGSDPRGSSGGSLDTPGPYGIKGAISFDRTGATIYTTPASDYSTWAHELLGHFNLHYEALDRRAITTLIRLSGIKPEMGAEYTSEGLRIRATKEVVNPNVHLNDLTPDQQRSVHEYFATQLESWLHQGRTKNPQLEQVMRHASKQMGDIYEAHELPALHPRVARIFDRMFKHNAPEGAGVIGGESEFAGRNYLPGHFFTARGGKGPRTMTTLVTGRAKEPMNKQPYTGAGLTTGNMPENPALLLAKGLKRDLKYMQTFRARQDLAALGRDELTPAQVAQLKSGSERWGLVNDQTGKSHVVPGWAHELMGSKEGTTVDEELLHENLGRLQALHNKLFVGKDNASAVLDPSQLSAYNEGTKVEGYKWVDRNLMGKDLKNAAQAQWGTGTFNPMRVVDAITNFEKNLIVYAKPGHLSTRILANAGFNLIHGALNGANLYRSWRMFTQLDPESRFRAMAIAGQGYTQSLIGEDVGIGARAAHAGANFYGNKIDAPWRFIALMQEARRAGYGSPEKFKELLYSNDPQVVADRNRIGIKANREAGDYARMGPTEQRVIRRIIFFYPWLKASTFFAGRALLEHPIKANLLLNLGQVGYNQEQKKLGPLDARDQGLIGFGSGAGLTTSQPSGINPYETPAQAWNTIQTILPGFLGGTPNTQAVQASGWLGPAPKALIDWALHLDPFGNAAPPAESGSQLLLNEMFTGSPEYLFAKQAYDALQGVNPNLNAAGVDRKEYPSSLLTQAERFFFGSWFSRPTNKSTANYLAMKEGAAGSGDTTKLDAYNFTQRVQAVGDPPPDPTIMQQLAYRSQLLQSIPKGSDVGHKAMIAAQFYAKITGDNSWVQRTVDEQHNPYASAAFYSALRTLIYGQYTAYNSTVVAKEKRLAFQQANAPTGG